MASKKTKKPKAVLAWGGFADGKLHVFPDHDGEGAPLLFQVFKHKSKAMEVYDDVREVRITPVVRKGKRMAEPKPCPNGLGCKQCAAITRHKAEMRRKTNG